MQPNTPKKPTRPSMSGVLPRQRFNRPTTTPKDHVLPPVVQESEQQPAIDPPSDVTDVSEPPQAQKNHSDNIAPQPIDETPKTSKKRSVSKLKIFFGVLITLAILIVAAVIGAKMWYDSQLQPVSSDKNAKAVRVVIENGSSPEQIGELLEEKKVIRSAFVFGIYTKTANVRSKLQAGAFSINPSESMPDIVAHIVAGKTDEFDVTFLPGDTLANNRLALVKLGYSEQEVDAALQKGYDHPALASKPASADLEGYLYGETYRFMVNATAEQIVVRALDELEKQIVKYDLVNAYKAQGLTLYEGITLASIIQREVANDDDEKQVAQVFYKRLKEGVMLGSDVTFIYPAKKLGVPATPDLDSPYNTRKYVGLPPGPISTPGLSALLAVASPAPGDYNFFLAGDDGKTYFTRTYEEHQTNIVKHCQKGCQ